MVGLAGSASGGGPVLTLDTLAITGKGVTFLSGGPLSASDTYDLLGSDFDLPASEAVFIKVDGCPGCDAGLLGHGAAGASALGSSPVLLSDQLTWRFTVALESDADTAAIAYNAGPPTFATQPTQTSVTADSSLLLAFTLHRRALVVLDGFSVEVEAIKSLPAGTASGSARLTLRDAATTEVAREQVFASATAAGSSDLESADRNGETHVLEAGGYTLEAVSDLFAGGIATASSSLQVAAAGGASATVSVTPCALIDKQPTSVAADLGATAEFLARVDVWIAGGGGRWHWERDGQPLSGQEPGIVILFPTLPSSILFITSVDESHLAEYRAVWTSHCGRIESELATLSLSDTCPVDLNTDGVLDIFDVQAFLNAYAAGNATADWIPDGLIDFFDVQAFLVALSGGCP
jgi:hypothetical protein